MKRLHQPVFALLISALLLASQQGAFAHLLGHLRSNAASVTSCQPDHGAADKLAEACTTCIAFASAGSNAPPATFIADFPSVDGDHRDVRIARAIAMERVGRYDARAPPSIL